MMGAVTERAPTRSPGPTRRCGATGPPPAAGRCHDVARPVVLASEWHGGARVSRVRRPDGSVFTVTVPGLAVYDHTEHLAPAHPWISDDTGQPQLTTVGALRLVAALDPSSGGRELLVG